MKRRAGRLEDRAQPTAKARQRPSSPFLPRLHGRLVDPETGREPRSRKSTCLPAPSQPSGPGLGRIDGGVAQEVDDPRQLAHFRLSPLSLPVVDRSLGTADQLGRFALTESEIQPAPANVVAPRFERFRIRPYLGFSRT